MKMWFDGAKKWGMCADLILGLLQPSACSADVLEILLHLTAIAYPNTSKLKTCPCVEKCVRFCVVRRWGGWWGGC